MPIRRVLIIDDEEDFRAVVAELLEGEGYEVDVAADGRSALDKLDDKPPPDMVLVDLVMPGVSGREVVARLRADARWAGIRVVVMTALPRADDVSPEVNAVLLKPFDVEQLMEALRVADDSRFSAACEGCW